VAPVESRAALQDKQKYRYAKFVDLVLLSERASNADSGTRACKLRDRNQPTRNDQGAMHGGKRENKRAKPLYKSGACWHRRLSVTLAGDQDK
jgi:hypothetical protein